MVSHVAVPAKLVSEAQVDGFERVRFWGDVPPPNFERVLREIARQRGGRLPREQQFLAISGGGSDGAFGAGLLVGWSARGTRPEFEAVTGVSTGALIAPFAFLGPKYDKQLRDIYTRHSTEDLLIPMVLAGLLGGSAVTDATPFENLLAKYITPRILTAVANEHRRGRRLLIGTTNLDAQRPVVWDMGAIAASGRPDALYLFRRVLQASASIPGVFPPVRIQVNADGRRYDELHVDGGTTAQVFFLPSRIMLGRAELRMGFRAERTVYVIRNGRIRPQYKPIAPSVTEIAKRSLTTLINSQANSELKLLSEASEKDSADFKLAYIPTDFDAVSNEAFDRSYMTKLFQVARRMAQRGYPWKDAPPD